MPLATWTAAVLAIGPGATLSHGSAAAVWGLGREREGVEVTTTRAGAKRRPGIRVHRVAWLDAPTSPATTACRSPAPARTLLDLAATDGPAAVDRRLQEARVRRLVDDDALRATLARNERRPGRPALAAASAGPFTRSELERAFLALVAAHGLPAPRANARRRGYEVDALWPEHGVAVELDGRGHATRAGHARDRRRDAALTAAGFTVLRFTWWDVTQDGHRVAATLAAALGSL
jgi:very-short-patch-repair endonuclease